MKKLSNKIKKMSAGKTKNNLPRVDPVGESADSPNAVRITSDALINSSKKKMSQVTIKPRKKTILVIEDERPLLEVVNTKLEKSGFEVINARSVDQVFDAMLETNGLGIIAARSIKQALEYLENLENVDAIWLDHNLIGKENGLDFVKKFKANGKKWKNIPIFVISNTESSGTIKSYVNLGVSKYYVKSNHRLDEIIQDINISLGIKN